MSRGAVLEKLARVRATLDVTIESIASGATSIAQVFAAADDPTIRHLYAVKAMEADPRVGKVRARRMLGDLGLGETVRIGDLTTAQMAAITAGVA